MPRSAADLLTEVRTKQLTEAPDGDLIDTLQRRGFLVVKDERAERQVKIETPKKGKVRFGIVTDTHLGSKYQQLTHWRDFTEQASRWGAEFMLHLGDVVDGGRMHRDQEFELFKHGADAQGMYAATAFPKLIGHESKKALKTYVIGGNHDQCVDDQTEILTADGWKHLDDFTTDAPVATLNPETRAFEWQVPQGRVVNETYDGEMYAFKHRSVDHVVSPKHELFVRSYHTGRWSKLRAEDYPPVSTYYQGLRAAEDWRGTPTEVSPDMLALFGWYVAEGNVDRYRVTISQSRRHSPYYQEIVDLIARLGWRTDQRDSMIRFNPGPEIAEFLTREFGKTSYEKRLPKFVKELPKDGLRAVLEAMCKGDAHRTGDTCWTYTTASDRLVDDLQEVAAKVGWASHANERQQFPVGDSGYVGSGRRVFLSWGNIYPWLHRPERFYHRGRIWCPIVPNGLWFARRNGQTVWTGNSFWNDAGSNVLRTLADQRPDLDFLGAPTATFHIGKGGKGFRVLLMHPGGGLSYARSYRLQKVVEQFAADDKPHVLLQGHYHVAVHVPGYRNVEAFIVPCFQAQTPFLKRQGLAPVIGGLLLEAEYSERGLEELTTKWVIYKTPLKNDYP